MKNFYLKIIIASILIVLPYSSFAQKQLMKTVYRGTKGLFRTEAKVLTREGVEAANKSMLKDAFKSGAEEIGKDYVRKASAKQLVRSAVRKNLLKEIEEKELGSLLRYGMLGAKKEIAHTEKLAVKVLAEKEALHHDYSKNVLACKEQFVKKRALENQAKKKIGKIVVSRKFANVEELIAFLKNENPKLAAYVERMNYYWGGKGSDFMKHLVYEKTSDGKIILRNSKYTKSEILIDGNKVYAKAGNNSKLNGELNRFLDNRDKMMPGMVYNVDDGAFVYKTDKLGRVVETETDLIKGSKVQRSAKRGPQTENSKAKGGKKDDDGGHLIASEINGPEESINIVPMPKSFNRGGEWRQLEEHLKKLQLSGKNVKVRQIVRYKGNSSIPVALEVHIIVDGVITKYTFKL